MNINKTNTDSPRVFISYSWTNQQHEQLVLDIATELCENGIDAILDKWDLKEGDDADAFMEQMVSDPTIKKVLIVCDKMYSEKSDNRKGGAGTEAQIISRKVYEQTDENKFVVAAFEMNEETGKPYLPVYYGSRKYIDFTDVNKYSQKFEELVRWVYDKPLFVKPEIGHVPDYIVSDEKKTLGTTAAYKRAISLVAEGKSNAAGAVKSYLSTFSSNLKSFQLPSCCSGTDYYDQVMDSVNNFVPYRDEWLVLLRTICNNSLLDATFNSYIKFFEDIHIYTRRRSKITYPYDQEEENMKFIEYELMLCFIAMLIKTESFAALAELFNTVFYNREADNELEATYSFLSFEHFINCIARKNLASPTVYLSLQANILKERMDACSELSSEDICQADFVAWLFYISRNHEERSIERWYPHNLLYSCFLRRPFEIFARAESLKYYDKIKVIFDYNSIDDIKELFKYIDENERVVPRWEYRLPDVGLLMNIQKIGSRK